MIVIKKIGLILVTAFAGLVCGTLVATPFIAWMNFLANDGPLFPPPMVAFGLLALPISVLILLIQIVAVSFELLARRSLRNAWVWLGMASGLFAGAGWSAALTSSQATPVLVPGIIALALIQAACVCGGHWLAGMLGFARAG